MPSPYPVSSLPFLAACSPPPPPLRGSENRRGGEGECGRDEGTEGRCARSFSLSLFVFFLKEAEETEGPPTPHRPLLRKPTHPPTLITMTTLLTTANFSISYYRTRAPGPFKPVAFLDQKELPFFFPTLALCFQFFLFARAMILRGVREGEGKGNASLPKKRGWGEHPAFVPVLSSPPPPAAE